MKTVQGSDQSVERHRTIGALTALPLCEAGGACRGEGLRASALVAAPLIRPAATGSARLFGIVCCLFLLSVSAQAVTFSAGLDRSTIRIGEQAVLTLRFDGGQPGGVPRLPDVPNLQIQFAGQNQQISIINGQRTASLLLNYVVVASQPGDYTIPAFQVPVGGTTLPSQPLALKVLAAAVKQSDTDAFRQYTFLKIRANKTNVFLGEPFTLEVRLYLSAGREIQMPALRSDGFTLVSARHQESREQVGNAVFNVLAFPFVATPVKAGKLPLGPAQCSFNLQISTDRIDIFGRGVRVQPVTILSDPLEINVQPLPAEGRPADFKGAVGNFQMTASAAPLDVAVGDPITVRVQVSGRGGFDSVPMPALDQWRDFKTYPPTVKTEVPDPLNLAGVKTFEQVVQPQNAELKELPAFTFSYFDPDARAYRTHRQPAMPLKVRAAAAAQAPTVVMSTNLAAATGAAATELVHIKPHLGMAATASAGALRQPGFWLLSGGPLLLWLALLTRRKRAERLANNPRLRRRREVEKLIASGLTELRQQAAAAQTEAFFAHLFRLLQEQLGERLDLPASAITEEVTDERLQALGASVELCQSIHQLFQACNAARYAPVRETAELTKLAEQFSAAVTELRKLEVDR